MASAYTPPPEVIAKVRTALESERHVWRTMDGLVADTELGLYEVLYALEILKRREELVVGRAWGGRDLFTTVAHYKRRITPFRRFLAMATGEAK